jgi:adenine deaminase
MTIWNIVNGDSDFETVSGYSEPRFIPPRMIEEWTQTFKRARAAQPNRKAPEPVSAIQQRIVKALHDHGVTILFGTDSPHVFNVPGFAIHREMRLMREAGLTPSEILRFATKNPGGYFRSKDRFGTIEVGARADLILLNGNPLVDLDYLKERSGVMVRGRWLPETVQRRLVEIARAVPFFRRSSNRVSASPFALTRWCE